MLHDFHPVSYTHLDVYKRQVLELAHGFLSITLPSTVLLGLGMACSALLRSVGDARRAMMVTLVPAIVTAVLDPLFIFYFGLGLDGAAIVLVLARVVMTGVGLYGACLLYTSRCV